MAGWPARYARAHRHGGWPVARVACAGGRAASACPVPPAAAGSDQHRHACGSGSMISIVLVDDHALVRSGYRRLLSAEADFEVVGEAATVARSEEHTSEL